MQLWALIVDGFREALDRKIFWVLVGITLLICVALLSIGFEGDHVSFMFGLWKPQTDHYNPAFELGRSHITGIVVYLAMDFFLGWVGVILMIIATASVFPTMMERGTIDVLLAKPMSRSKLFLYKYISSMVFVLLQATVFVVLTFLIMGLRWEVWVPGYLLCIPLLVLLFSYVYCVSVYVAVKTRSVVAAILLSLGAWVFFAMPKTAVDVFESFPDLQEHKTIYRAVRVVSWIPPKTADIPYLAARWSRAGTSLDIFPTSMMEANDSPAQMDMERAREMEAQQLKMNPAYSIGSSLLFEAVVLLLAMWSFARSDY